jgi:hypothetical protein
MRSIPARRSGVWLGSWSELGASTRYISALAVSLVIVVPRAATWPSPTLDCNTRQHSATDPDLVTRTEFEILAGGSNTKLGTGIELPVLIHRYHTRISSTIGNLFERKRSFSHQTVRNLVISLYIRQKLYLALVQDGPDRLILGDRILN